jgi:hypothetical protein
MPRRASSSANPVWILAIVVFIVASMAGGYYLYNTASDPYRTLTALDTEAYLQNSNSLRGNTYKIRATIVDQLAWSAETGKLYSVEVEKSTGSDVIPLLIPPEFNSINIQKGQKFYFQVEVGDKGLLKVKGIKKV